MFAAEDRYAMDPPLSGSPYGPPPSAYGPIVDNYAGDPFEYTDGTLLKPWSGQFRPPPGSAPR